MKVFNVLVLILLALPGISKAEQSKANGGKVSTVVTNSFAEKCPEVNVKKWKKKDGRFIAVFLKGDKECEASFDADGNWLQTKDRIKWEQLPSPVRETYYASDFKWLNRNRVEKLQTTNYKEVYLIGGDNSNQESGPLQPYKLWITPDGKIVKTKLVY